MIPYFPLTKSQLLCGACMFPRECVGFHLSQFKNTLQRFIKDSKSSPGVRLFLSVWPCDRLVTCPGCTETQLILLLSMHLSQKCVNITKIKPELIKSPYRIFLTVRHIGNPWICSKIENIFYDPVHLHSGCAFWPPQDFLKKQSKCFSLTCDPYCPSTACEWVKQSLSFFTSFFLVLEPPVLLQTL